MHRLIVLFSLTLLLALPGAAQHTRHNLTVGAGVALPREELQPFLEKSAALTFGYGFRPVRFFQVETGLDTVFGAARVRDFFDSGFGPLRIRDYQFLWPFGGRVILPLADDRVLLYGGGGGAYLYYGERINQPSDFFRIDCRVCADRSGWGWYALTGASVALDSGRHFRLGATVKNYQGETDGFQIGTLPGFTTRDRWLVVTGEFTFSF